VADCGPDAPCLCLRERWRCGDGGNAFQLDATAAGFDIDAYRDPRRYPFRPGDRVATDGRTVEVKDVRNGRPTIIGAEFDRPLEDPSVYFVTRTSSGFQPVAIPPLGVELYLGEGPEIAGKRSVDEGIDGK